VMAVEGNGAVLRATGKRKVAIATMDDELYYLDLTRFAGRFSYVRSSLREAGAALVGELLRQCEDGSAPAGHVIPSTWHIRPQLSAETLKDPLPSHRQQTPF